MSKLFRNALKPIIMSLSATLFSANAALAEFQKTIKPIAQLTSVEDLLQVQPTALNTADKLTTAHVSSQETCPTQCFSNTSVLQPNAQLISQEETQGTPAAPVDQQSKPKKRKAPGYSNYIGIGGDIGLSGDKTALGSGGLAIFSKTRITDNLSLHSTNVVFGSRTAISTNALTFGVPIRNQSSGQVIAFPFIGGGVLIKGSFNINGLVVGGVDVPVSQNLTATTQLHVGFPDGNTEVGLQFGIGYNFSLF